MRKPTQYEIYIRRLKDYYRIKKIEEPEWVEKASRYYRRLFYTHSDFWDICTSTNISKETMKWLSSLKTESLDGLPDELICETSINDALIAMYEELMAGKDEYFIKEWTLSKKGRHKMRDCVNAIPSIRNIAPPHNAFTNVPNDVYFSDDSSVWDGGYTLAVMMDASWILIRNKNEGREERLIFTENFLDDVISLLQLDNLYPYMVERDLSRDSEQRALYHDFQAVKISVGWSDYFAQLSDISDDNPFVKLLELIKKEYSATIEEKHLVVPWFKILE